MMISIELFSTAKRRVVVECRPFTSSTRTSFARGRLDGVGCWLITPNMLQWLRALWYRRCRQTDLEILWPACLDEAPDLDRAKAAFAWHAFIDPAWLALGRDEIIRFIDQELGRAY
jgi:hypothetical protein